MKHERISLLVVLSRLFMLVCYYCYLWPAMLMRPHKTVRPRPVYSQMHPSETYKIITARCYAERGFVTTKSSICTWRWSDMWLEIFKN